MNQNAFHDLTRWGTPDLTALPSWIKGEGGYYVDWERQEREKEGVKRSGQDV